jgi:hypothetical protein
MGRHAMIKQVFDIESYWKVIVYYDVDFNLFARIVKELIYAGASTEIIKEAYDMLKSGQAKAATYNNIDWHISVVLFNPHESKRDYINSIVHEAEHVKQAMLAAYDVEDEGEQPAYTIGHLVEKMYHVFGEMVCNCKAYD